MAPRSSSDRHPDRARPIRAIPIALATSAGLWLACLGVPPGEAPGHAELEALLRGKGDVYETAYMHWAVPAPWGEADFFLVLGGVVRATRETPPQSFGSRTGGVLEIERVLLNRENRGEGLGGPTELPYRGERFLVSDGFEGCEPGSRFLVQLVPYDGWFAIPPTTNRGCWLGLRVSGWDDPVVIEVETRIRERAAFP